MTSRTRAAVLALVLSGGCSAEEATRPQATGGAAGTAPDASLGGGSGGGLILPEAGTPDAPFPPFCGWLEPEAPDASVAGAEQWCDAGLVNPSACPATEPKAGSPCTDLGLDCKYASFDDGVVVARCEGTWQARAHLCVRSCGPLDGGAKVLLTQKTCGESGVVPCGVSPLVTMQELLDGRLRHAAKCCGLGSEGMVTVWLQDGCAIGFTAAVPPLALVAFNDCLRGMLEGYRIECAEGLSCAEAVVTTLP
ncbi:MAG: hypothetical protein HS104_22940 [Polyangiaceae bacterium]|nr:hypothetical protein [Polyangiaceae bacterium]MCE7892483.1 hypothetical protein [Sorangiineae bacterium PRO1]